MHLRYETTYALGLFRNAVGLTRRNCAGRTEASAPELSLDGSRREKLRRMWSSHYFVLTERLDVCRCSTRGDAHRYGR